MRTTGLALMIAALVVASPPLAAIAHDVHDAHDSVAAPPQVDTQPNPRIRWARIQLRLKSGRAPIRTDPSFGPIGSIGPGSLIEIEVPQELIPPRGPKNRIALRKLLRKLNGARAKRTGELLRKVTILDPKRRSNHHVLSGQEAWMALDALARRLQVKNIEAGEPEDQSATDLPSIEVPEKEWKLQPESSQGSASPCDPAKDPGAITSLSASLQSVLSTPGGSLQEAVLRYSNSKDVHDAIVYALQKKHPRSTGWCYRYVKYALLNAGLVDSYLDGRSAKGAGGQLERQGFVNLLKKNPFSKTIQSPYDAPKGAILVYSGGPHGHVEIRTQEGFVSDYYSDMPVTGNEENGRSGRHRKLIGVYIRP